MAGGAETSSTPSVIVHSLAQALAAARVARDLGRPLMIESAAGAGGSTGVGWFVELAALARTKVPDAELGFLLDCADEAGTALAAFRRGLVYVRFSGEAAMAARLRAIAAAYGATLITAPSTALDLYAKADPDACCRSWFAEHVVLSSGDRD